VLYLPLFSGIGTRTITRCGSGYGLNFLAGNLPNSIPVLVIKKKINALTILTVKNTKI
jgi:hypothetical protein